MFLHTSCPICRRPGPAPCVACAAAMGAAPPGPVAAVLAYEGAGRVLLQRLKFRNARPAAGPLGASMARLTGTPRPDVVTWAPTGAARRRRRGYDQAELLARSTAAALGVPCRRLLRRTDRAGPQTGRTRADRLGQPPQFAVRGIVLGQDVVVVDDVVTTGATLAAAAASLRAAGAGHVRMVAAAATP